ncbi:MAG: amino acid ABC transporter permease [Acidimicrobiales bacterium]|nr:amino acid ABC transporter permease [Acidimicrobiales bacterium]
MTAVATHPSGAPRGRAAGPPDTSVGPVGWMRENLFNSALNAVLTALFGAFIAWAAVRLALLVFVNSDWEIVQRNLTSFMLGRFDRAELWRPWAATGILAVTFGLVGGAGSVTAEQIAQQEGRQLPRITWRDRLRRFWPMALLVVVLLGFTRTIAPTLLALLVLAVGVVARSVGTRLPSVLNRFIWVVALLGFVAAVVVLSRFGGVGWDEWGGLHLSIFATGSGIVLAFPLGLLLAMGRRSSLPAVRIVSVGYIEFFRGVPLITLLLMGQFMIGFFLPGWIDAPSQLARALVAIVIFESAYIAEIVRGGLQGVDRGQIEAGQALGMSPLAVVRRIQLPQALRAVIPAMVGQFISLFQDTTLFFILGFDELLNVGQRVTNQPDFVGQGLQSVTLPFVAFVFWAISYSMSRESRRLETRLGVGTR